MMPIVFCASLEPWLNAMNAADRTWSRRKRSLIGRGLARRKTFRQDDHQREADREARGSAR